MRAGARVDEVDARQIPARDAAPEMDQPAISRGHLEAHPLHREGAVTAALSAGDLHAEGPPERLGARTLAADVGAFEVALERRLPKLAVEGAVILLLDPRLGSPVEQFEGELRFPFGHRHESPLDAGPEVLLFAILLRAIRQRQIVEDAESLAALDRLCGLHRSTVVTEDPSRHFALLESLTETVDELLGVLSVQVPLRVAAHARAVVERAK